MAKAWETLGREETADGELELRTRGSGDFLITLDGRVLMNSRANRSETALAKLACDALGNRPQARVLIGGLGMGCTLAAALAALPGGSKVVVAELHPVIATWCEGPLAALNERALLDARVELAIDDVVEIIRRARAASFDAIVLDLFEGPHASTNAKSDPLYGSQAIERVARALVRDGIFAVWSESPDRGFEQRLTRAGFDVECTRPGRGGLRHVVYVGRLRGR